MGDQVNDWKPSPVAYVTYPFKPVAHTQERERDRERQRERDERQFRHENKTRLYETYIFHISKGESKIFHADVWD